jgi:hypothetical protein
MKLGRLREKLQYGPQWATKSTGLVATFAFIAGGLLLVCSSYIHFHLWQKVGYRRIPTIGPLFILQSIAGLGLGLAVMAIRRVWIAVLGTGIAISTMAGFLLSVEVGLFRFKDTWSAPFAHRAFFLEVAVIVILGVASTLCIPELASADRAGPTPTGQPSGA